MPRKKPYARIAITLPPEVLASADRLARELDRSRSWVVAESIREYSARGGPAQTRVRDAAGRVSEPVTIYDPEAPDALGQLRYHQLKADLLLTPLERVLAAEETERMAWLVHPPAGQQLLMFDRPEDYLRWKQRAMLAL